MPHEDITSSLPGVQKAGGLKPQGTDQGEGVVGICLASGSVRLSVARRYFEMVLIAMIPPVVVAATVLYGQDPKIFASLSPLDIARVSIATAMAMATTIISQGACKTIHMHILLVYPSFLFILSWSRSGLCEGLMKHFS